jgi:hypothetical protein
MSPPPATPLSPKLLSKKIRSENYSLHLERDEEPAKISGSRLVSGAPARSINLHAALCRHFRSAIRAKTSGGPRPSAESLIQVDPNSTGSRSSIDRKKIVDAFRPGQGGHLGPSVPRAPGRAHLYRYVPSRDQRHSFPTLTFRPDLFATIRRTSRWRGRSRFRK